MRLRVCGTRLTSRPYHCQVVLASAAEMYPKYHSTLAIYKHPVFQDPAFLPYAEAVRLCARVFVLLFLA